MIEDAMIHRDPKREVLVLRNRYRELSEMLDKAETVEELEAIKAEIKTILRRIEKPETKE